MLNRMHASIHFPTISLFMAWVWCRIHIISLSFTSYLALIRDFIIRWMRMWNEHEMWRLGLEYQINHFDICFNDASTILHLIAAHCILCTTHYEKHLENINFNIWQMHRLIFSSNEFHFPQTTIVDIYYLLSYHYANETDPFSALCSLNSMTTTVWVKDSLKWIKLWLQIEHLICFSTICLFFNNCSIITFVLETGSSSIDRRHKTNNCIRFLLFFTFIHCLSIKYWFRREKRNGFKFVNCVD